MDTTTTTTTANAATTTTITTISTTSTTTTTTTTTTGAVSTTPTTIKNAPLIVPTQDTLPTTISETPITKRPKARPSPYSKPNPILLSSDRRSRKRKSLTWRPDDKLKEWHYFELIADERVNVSPAGRAGTDHQIDASAGGSSSSIAINKLQLGSIGDKISTASVDPLRRSNDGKANEPNEPKLPAWRPLISIDFTPELPSPGWNSIERSAQAERETYVLGAIDLPGQPSTLDEPDQQQQQLRLASATSSTSNNGPTMASGSGGKSDSTNGGEGTSSVKIIPIDNPEGMTSEYQSLYECEIVNGVRISNDNPQAVVQSIGPFCNQQSQLLTGQFQQQLAHSTQNPFAFQDMGAQFQQQTQMQLQYPFQPQQQPMMPFTNQQQQAMQMQQQQHQQQQQLQMQQQQAADLPGPVTPWLNYPFNQVSENSHAHLFRRPAT